MLWFFVRKIILTDKNCCDVFICLQDQNDRNAIIKRCAPKTKIHAKKIQNMSKRGIAGFITIPLYCTFHKHANSKVEQRFSLPSIIIMITRKEPWNTPSIIMLFILPVLVIKFWKVAMGVEFSRGFKLRKCIVKTWFRSQHFMFCSEGYTYTL